MVYNVLALLMRNDLFAGSSFVVDTTNGSFSLSEPTSCTVPDRELARLGVKVIGDTQA